MDTYSAAEAARRLGTNTPRVVRALKRLGLEGDARGANGRFCLTEAMLGRLRGELRVMPRIEGFSATEVRVLGALACAPLGLASVRVLARQAGLSPTAASRAVKALDGKGFIRREGTVIAAGRAREVSLIHVNRHHREWPHIQSLLRGTASATRRLKGNKEDVPPRLRHLFWNTAPSQLSVATSGSYIATRLLTRMDFDGLAWGADHLSRCDWEQAAKGRGFDESVRALAHNLARNGRS
jgi:DNA-binding transcriptional regulator YhcF (GntR family)